MGKYRVLYNPSAGRGAGEREAKKLAGVFEEIAYTDITKIENYSAFFNGLDEQEQVIVCGGDGTLNRFVNDAGDMALGKQLYYYACGSGNDFMREVQKDEKPLLLQGYIENLPVVEVKGKTYRFINGVGYGIDGYCCEEGDRQREKSDKPINYTGIAIKGLLFHYKPTNATVVVDGKEYHFKKVWLAPTMNGKYYGGGMIPCPKQDRAGDTISVLIFHGTGKLKTLMMFPSLFKGEHIKYEKHITVLSGKEITVKFDAPRALQIDGETIIGVTEYTARK